MKEKAKATPMGVELIDNTLQIVQSMQTQKKELEKENRNLKEQIRRLDGIKMDSACEKAKYMEGAVWMAKKLSSEIENLCHGVDNLLLEFDKRGNEMQRFNNTGTMSAASFGYAPPQYQQMNDIVGSDRNQGWFLESIKQMSIELYEKAVTVMETAILN
mmetsp:Transcript_32094/g.31410  ORF Transcript_32094/g.31410 Transcript_32094/m.31410 type:complete len:159 (+) Transcript_32094:550-1026(+)